MNQQEILYLFYGLWGWFIFSFLIIILLWIRTPAFTFLWAQYTKRPVTLNILKTGVGKWTVPNKIDEGWAYFKRNKQDLGYVLSRAASMKAGHNEIGLIMEERGGYVPPQCFAIAKKLHAAGFGNYTEAEIAYHIHQLEMENDIVVKPGVMVKVVDEDTGKTEELPVMKFLTRELKERGINKFLDPQDEIREVIHEGKHNLIGRFVSDFAYMENFFKYSMNPSAVSDKISAERLYQREKAQVGMLPKLGREQAMFVMIVLISMVVAYVILVSTGGLDWVVHQFRAPAVPNIPMPPTTLPGTPTGITIK